MKDQKISKAGVTASASLQRQSKPVTSNFLAIRAIIATVVILTLGLIVWSEGQTLVPPAQGSQPAQTRPSSLSLLVEQGRKHPSYQVFAGHLALPAIKVVDATTLEVEGKIKIDVRRLDQLTMQQKETLAGQFGVPVGVVDKPLGCFSNNVPSDAVQVAGKLRVAVIDYNYLLQRWNQYRPPTGKEEVKTGALLALQVGDIDKAWGMYVDLPRPKPPAELRIVGQK